MKVFYTNNLFPENGIPAESEIIEDLGIAEDRTAALALINAFLKKQNEEFSYDRSAWDDEHLTVHIDYGSWSKFFVLVFDTPEGFKQYKKDMTNLFS